MIKFSKKRIGKKGIVDNFLALLITFFVLVAIFGILYIILYSKMKTNETIAASDANIKEGLYTTRILLNEEVRSGYKVYDLVIDTVNNKDYETFEKDLSGVIHRFYPAGNMNEEWKIIINDECFLFNNEGAKRTGKVVTTGTGGMGSSYSIVVDTCNKNQINLMPRVTVPNPNGKNILVLFKPSSPMDTKAVRIFGSRADQLNGISAEDIPVYSNDGRELTRIEGIPNIACDETATVVGKICAADEDLVRQLEKISTEQLVPNGMTMKINQAYRTYEIQKNLYNQNCNAAGECRPLTCNPDTSYMCPHMQAGAIDITLYDKDDKSINRNSPEKVEALMCQYGFIRIKSEDWHFEFGTNKWEEIQEKYDGVKKPCVY
jgi:hypothetical protein